MVADRAADQNGVARTGVSLDAVALLLFAVTLVAGVVTVYGFLLILSTMAFWFVRLDNILVIFQALFGQAGRWPVGIYPGWLRIASIASLAPAQPAEGLAASTSGNFAIRPTGAKSFCGS